MELEEVERAVIEAFGEERGALLKVEIQHLTEKGYLRRDLVDFLDKFALPSGVFYMLSMVRRGNIALEDLERSAVFIFNSYSVIGREFERYVPTRGRILDYGCGRGLVSCALARKGFEVHGVDIHSGTLDVAKKLADELRCRASFHQIEAGQLPFNDMFFDLAFSHWSFHEIQQNQQQKAAAELFRVLKPGGYTFIIDQDEVASFTRIRTLMDQHGFKLESEKILLLVYDHGKASQAVMLIYKKNRRAT